HAGHPCARAELDEAQPADEVLDVDGVVDAGGGHGQVADLAGAARGAVVEPAVEPRAETDALAEPQEREALLVAPGVALGDRREVDVVLDADADTQDVLEVAAQVLARPAGELADERDVARAGRDGRLDADDGGRDARDR